MSGASNYRREHCTRGVVPSEAGFAHAGAIVNYECGYFIIHDCKLK